MRNFPFFQIYLKFVYLIEDPHFWLHSDDEYARPWPSSESQEWEAVRPRNPAPTCECTPNGSKNCEFCQNEIQKTYQSIMGVDRG